MLYRKMYQLGCHVFASSYCPMGVCVQFNFHFVFVQCVLPKFPILCCASKHSKQMDEVVNIGQGKNKL